MKLSRYVALFRGINVGRAKRVAMADLRALMEGLGYDSVRTLLNSGNVVFTAPAAATGMLAARIEDALATTLGVTSRVTVLTAAELATIVAENPLLEIADDPSRFLVAFLNDPADRARLEPLLKQDWAPDVLAVGGAPPIVVPWWHPREQAAQGRRARARQRRDLPELGDGPQAARSSTGAPK